MEKTLTGREKAILQHLKNLYYKRNANFFFKAKHLREIGMDNRLIGRTLAKLERKNKLKIWRKEVRSSYTYITDFKPGAV